MNNKIYKKTGKGSLVLELLDSAVRYNNWLFAKINPYLGKRNGEIGAGQGTISEYVIKDNKVFLSDKAYYNVAILKQKFAKNKNLLGVDNALRNSKGQLFDCIYSSNVLEHIKDDTQFIGDCLKLLKSKGYFVAIAPASQLLYSEFDQLIGHYRRYTLEDKHRIELYLEKNFNSSRIIQFRFFNQIGMLGWFVKMKLLKQKNVKSEDVKLFELLLPVNKTLDRLNLPFGQSVLLVIRK